MRLIAAIVRRNVYVMPNLSPEWNTYAELPHWLKDGDPLMKLLEESVPAPVIARMKKTYENRDPAALDRIAHAVRDTPAQSRETWPRPTPRSFSAATPDSKIISSGCRNSMNWKAWPTPV